MPGEHLNNLLHSFSANALDLLGLIVVSQVHLSQGLTQTDHTWKGDHTPSKAIVLSGINIMKYIYIFQSKYN